MNKGTKLSLQERSPNALQKSSKASQYKRLLSLVLIASTVKRSLEKRLSQVRPDVDLNGNAVMKEIRFIIKAFNGQPACLQRRNLLKTKSEWAVRHCLAEAYMPAEARVRTAHVEAICRWAV